MNGATLVFSTWIGACLTALAFLAIWTWLLPPLLGCWRVEGLGVSIGPYLTERGACRRASRCGGRLTAVYYPGRWRKANSRKETNR